MADTERASSPSPEERTKLDAEAKMKEQEEQSKLPYKWTQTIGDVDLTAPIPANIKGRDLDVKITKTSLKAGIKGQEPIIDVCSPPSLPPPSHSTVLINPTPGHPPPCHHHRRVRLDARDDQGRQRARYPPRQD